MLSLDVISQKIILPSKVTTRITDSKGLIWTTLTKLTEFFPIEMTVWGSPMRQNDILIDTRTHIIENRFQRIFKTLMKLKQSLSPNAHKKDKTNAMGSLLHVQLKPHYSDSRDEYLSPVNLKLAKEKNRSKKENKPKKGEEKLEEKKTKRKQVKRYKGDLDSTLLINQDFTGKVAKKELEKTTKLKARTLEKEYRNSSKQTDSKKSSRCDWFNGFMLQSTIVEEKVNQNKKIDSKSRLRLTLPNEEYLFIGDDFYSINNLCPTKRLLNTLREACTTSDTTTKFITQDKTQKAGAKLELKKRTNIFAEARKEIQLKEENKKAIVIQKWWKRYLAFKNLNSTKSNPQHLSAQLQHFEEKVSFRQSHESEQELKSPFEIGQMNQSPFREHSGGQDSIIASFNSAQFVDQKHPKKIEFTSQNLSNLLSASYKLPEQSEVNTQENDQIFNDYSKFKMREVLTNSQELSPKNQKSELGKPILEEIEQSKIETVPYNLLKEFEEATKIKELIQLRVIQQKGQMRQADSYTSKVGINTSILGIHNFLVRFFNFYIQNYRDQFVSLLNMPFGYSIPARLRHHGGSDLPVEEQEDEEGVIFGLKEIIDQDKLQEYYCYVKGQNSSSVINNFYNANLELERIHSRAVIDYFNEELNAYRPYRQINGVPYPWNHSYKALTFYFVTEQNIAEIFEKVQILILKSCSLLSGIHLPGTSKQQEQKEFNLTEFMEDYEQKNHGLILEHNEDKELKQANEAIKKEAFQFDSQFLTGMLIDVSKKLFDDLLVQSSLELLSLSQRTSIY